MRLVGKVDGGAGPHRRYSLGGMDAADQPPWQDFTRECLLGSFIVKGCTEGP